MKRLFLLLFLFFSFYSNAQVYKIEIQGKHFPAPTMESLVKMVNMNNKEWQSYISGFDLSFDGLVKGDYEYSYNFPDGYTFSTVHTADGSVVVIWSFKGTMTKFIMEELQDKLKSYFSEYKNGSPTYAFNFSGASYSIILDRDDQKGEWAIIVKHK